MGILPFALLRRQRGVSPSPASQLSNVGYTRPIPYVNHAWCSYCNKRKGVFMNSLSRRSFLALGGIVCAGLFAGCGTTQNQSNATGTADSSSAATTATGVDYMALVNKQHKLPDGWEEAVELVSFTNSVKDKVEVETKAYDAYLKLKEDLESEGVYVDLDSAYRSVEAQQKIVDDFTKKYGEEYVKLYVAVPGYSEHHTGLALDLFLIIDGKTVNKNEDMVKHPDVWKKIHAKLADHGFILRYLPQKKIETGYSYEPWHIRYLDDPAIAKEIADKNATFEAFLGKVDPVVAGCTVDYGKSKIYSDSDIDSALDVILAEFKTWKGCKLNKFSFAGDEACGKEELAYVNELREAKMPDTKKFDQVIVCLTDFHSPKAEEAVDTAWDPDTDYRGYSWHLGRTGSDGSWKLLTWGYA